MGLFSKKDTLKEKYSNGLKKPRTSLIDKIKGLFASFKKVDEEYFNSLEDLLIEADVGAKLSIELVEELKQETKLNNITDPNIIMDNLFKKIEELYDEDDYSTSLNMQENGPTVILVIGVNGVGKTTSIAKLANLFKSNKKKVLLVAADTFRAGAIEQLDVWSKRVGVDIVTGPENSDPSSVIFDGVKKGKDNNYDVIIIDTAGRLQTKVNLMNEANKMYKVIGKIIPDAPHESLLVLDATIGQNGVFQAKEFLEVCKVTGIILTKMDGISKGGIILPIKQELNIPVKFIGLGEGLDDLVEFDLDTYLEMLRRGKDEK